MSQPNEPPAPHGEGGFDAERREYSDLDLQYCPVCESEVEWVRVYTRNSINVTECQPCGHHAEPVTRPADGDEEGERAKKCPDGLLPDGPKCPRCGVRRAPSGTDGGTWVHFPEPVAEDTATEPDDTCGYCVDGPQLADAKPPTPPAQEDTAGASVWQQIAEQRGRQTDAVRAILDTTESELREALATVEAQARELAQLKAMSDAMGDPRQRGGYLAVGQALIDQDAKIAEQAREIEGLRAARDRYRQALTDIVTSSTWLRPNDDEVGALHAVARAALVDVARAAARQEPRHD